MSVKIKVSYNTEEELAGVIRLLSPVLKDYKVSRNKEGRYKKAYAELDMLRNTKVDANVFGHFGHPKKGNVDIC